MDDVSPPGNFEAEPISIHHPQTRHSGSTRVGPGQWNQAPSKSDFPMDAPSNLRRLLGPRMPLAVPGCMLTHLARPEARAREADALADMLAPYEGFDFGTFQVVEHDVPTAPGFDEVSAFDDWPAPDLEWHFVLSSVLEAFIAAGLDEIDVQMFLRQRLGIEIPSMHDPWTDFAPALGTTPPRHVCPARFRIRRLHAGDPGPPQHPTRPPLAGRNLHSPVARSVAARCAESAAALHRAGLARHPPRLKRRHHDAPTTTRAVGIGARPSATTLPLGAFCPYCELLPVDIASTQPSSPPVVRRPEVQPRLASRPLPALKRPGHDRVMPHMRRRVLPGRHGLA